MIEVNREQMVVTSHPVAITVLKPNLGTKTSEDA